MLTAIVCISTAAVSVAAGSRDKRGDGYVTISDKLDFFKQFQLSFTLPDNFQIIIALSHSTRQ